VTWSLSPNVGSLSSTGLYTAPFGIGPAQIVTIAATDSTDSTKTAGVAVSLIPYLTVDIGPSGFSLGPSQTQQFTAIVRNAANLGVTWSLSPQLGTISPAGLYQAPATVSSRTSVTIQATSIANPSNPGYAQVTLTPAQ